MQQVGPKDKNDTSSINITINDTSSIHSIKVEDPSMERDGVHISLSVARSL